MKLCNVSEKGTVKLRSCVCHEAEEKTYEAGKLYMLVKESRGEPLKKRSKRDKRMKWRRKTGVISREIFD